MLWPSYNWRLHCCGAYTLYILLFLVRNRNLGEMKRRSLVIFAGDPSKDFGSVLLFFYMWELCFSLVSPLWESCYSLASCKVMSLKVIYFQSIFLIDFYIKRRIYMQEYGITSPNCCAAGNSKESRNCSKKSRMWLSSTDITG